MYNLNKAQQSKSRVHISWDILYSQETDRLRRYLILRTTYAVHIINTHCIIRILSSDCLVNEYLCSYIDSMPLYTGHHKSASLQWRHTNRDCVSNHQRLDCLLNRLFMRRSKKVSKLRVTGPLWGGFTGHHKGPVTRKTFPFDDVIMVSISWLMVSLEQTAMPCHETTR